MCFGYILDRIDPAEFGVLTFDCAGVRPSVWPVSGTWRPVEWRRILRRP